MNPPVGQLRHQVTIQKRVTTQDSEGMTSSTWTTYLVVMASQGDLTGRELLSAQSIVAEVTSQFVIRYRSGIKPNMRALYNGRTFDIRAALDPEGRRRFLTLLCREVLSGGVDI